MPATGLAVGGGGRVSTGTGVGGSGRVAVLVGVLVGQGVLVGRGVLDGRCAAVGEEISPWAFGVNVAGTVLVTFVGSMVMPAVGVKVDACGALVGSTGSSV